MLFLHNMDELINNQKNLELELQRIKNELVILYEVSNAMLTTLKLEEILYITLTGITAHSGLGFNRAMLFLIDEKNNILEGRMGIGPDNAEEAGHIWHQIESQKLDLEDLINNFRSSNPLGKSHLNHTIKHIRVPLSQEEGGILALALLDGMPLHVTKELFNLRENDPLLHTIHSQDFVTAPLKSKDKTIGLIVADNMFTKKPITKDDIRLLTMLTNQAALAIENSRLYEQTLIHAHTDSLTNLWNHGFFQDKLEEKLSEAENRNSPLSILMIDLDDFKPYNDKLGHQKGDQLLVKIATIIKETFRREDFVCRYGGEEFVIIMPDTHKSKAYEFAENIRKIIADYPLPHEDILPGKKQTISIGIATCPEDGQHKSTLIDHADRALYEAKRKGKNRIYG
ncbi:MAG: sensor domain-containing diguanylate cyclase [Candidatus Omnitrophota bacterium]